MKIALAQLNYTIGDFNGNCSKIIRTVKDAKKRGVDLVVFSELCVCGYPPLDLLEHKYFIEKGLEKVHEIASVCDGISAIVGAPDLNRNSLGKNLFNAAFFLHNGKVEQVVYKTLLPTYDVFDEYRYFESNNTFQVIRFKETNIALTICEDLWFKQPILTGFGKDKLYTISPLKELTKQGIDLVINIASSPYSYHQEELKREILTAKAIKYSAPIIYVNQVGAHTDLIFDGGSGVINARGEVIKRLPFFKEEVSDFDTSDFSNPAVKPVAPMSADYIPQVHDALILGIRDYFVKMNFKTAVLGLSGGIDSAVTLVLATEALGKENVRVLLLPSKYSSDHSVNDSVKLAENLPVKYDIVSIKEIVSQFDVALKPLFGDMPPGLTEENIQARIRGNLLMAVSNKFGTILLNTSNKSEAAVGFGTLYGDMSGGLSVLGDVYKTDVFKLARYINRNSEIIPENIINKPPSAELRPDQKDTDSLPDYGTLDIILFNYIEKKKQAKEIIDIGIDEETVLHTIKMVNASEYKRYQTPPVLRISSKAFGTGRRMPLVAKYE